MKENILIALAIVLLGSMWLQFSMKANDNRYDVVSNGMLTILVDKQTGMTWRNCVCNEKSPIPGCWEKMMVVNPNFDMQPKGEAKLSKKIIKETKKIEKQQKKEAEKKARLEQKMREARQNEKLVPLTPENSSMIKPLPEEQNQK